MLASRRAMRVVALAALCAAYSCGGDATQPTIVAVASVAITPLQPSFTVGETLQLAATIRDQAGNVLAGRTVIWSSSTTAIATVDATTGLARAIAPGVAALTATCEGRSTSVSVVVFPVVTRVVATVVIDSVVPPLYVGRTAQLSVVARDALGAAIGGRTTQWTSSATSIVTVSGSGLLTGITAGSATITAKVDGMSGTRAVVVQPAPSAIITVLPAFGSVVRGVDYSLKSVVTDIDGHPLVGHPVTYTSADPSIATVSSTGLVHPLANGFVTITGTVDSIYQAVTRLTVMDPRTVSGQVITADGAAPTNLIFVALAGSGNSAQRFSTTVDGASGAFSLLIPAFPASPLYVEYFVDAATGSTRRYHPSYSRQLTGDAPNVARILLIPHSIVPDSGTYAGQTFAVDLNEAFVPVCTNTSDQNCQSYWPSYWLSGIKTWPDAARPVPLAFDRTTGSVSATDSTVAWNTIHAMEADVGRALYKPAAFAGYTSPGYTAGMVLVSQDPTVAPFAGYTNWSWDGQSAIYQAKTRLASSTIFANNSLVTHELNHALGFHHTCRWATVMGGYGCAQQTRLTPGDVAYYHLAELVHRRVLAVSPTWGILEALQGVRVVELGVAASDAIPSQLLPLKSKLALPGSDGAP